MKVCIFGAGSVGVHYARAWSKRRAQVTVFDISPAALERFSAEIWPQRYNQTMPDSVELRLLDDLERQNERFDIVVVGTPPSSHSELAELSITSELADYVCIQKPITIPSLVGIESFLRIEELARNSGITLLSGYNHRYSEAFRATLDELADRESYSQEPMSIDVDWRESWDGILKAHHWLTSPSDSYLGFTHQGGGALFEHSHGLDLALYLWRELRAVSPEEFEVEVDWSEDGNYDRYSSFSMKSNELRMTVRQNVTSFPPSKSAEISGENWSLKVDFGSDADSVTRRFDSQEKHVVTYSKNREADFDAEVRVVEQLQGQDFSQSSSLRRLTDFSMALDTSIVGAAAIKWSENEFELAQQFFRLWGSRQKSGGI